MDDGGLSSYSNKLYKVLCISEKEKIITWERMARIKMKSIEVNQPWVV